MVFEIRFKNLYFGAFWDPIGPDLCKFGPSEKCHSTLIPSAYYALTFCEEIGKNIMVFK